MDKKTELNNMVPIQYFICQQYKYQHMYTDGNGQQAKSTISHSHALSVGKYILMVEVEIPFEQLVGEEIKLKVAIQSSETYFMLGSRY